MLEYFTVMDSDNALWSVRHALKNSKVAFTVGTIDEIGWAFRKEDKDLQAVVRKLFETQKSNVKSPLNKLWKKNYGVTLIQFKRLVKATR